MIRARSTSRPVRSNEAGACKNAQPPAYPVSLTRTLADLAGKENITSNEMLEAIQFRSLDRQLFE
jgi:hypothetical protein